MTRKAKVPKGIRPRSVGDLSAVSAEELQAELARKNRRIQTLRRRHERLLARATALREEIASLGGAIERPAPGEKTARPAHRRNEMNLVEALKRALGAKSMTVADATKSVLGAGYRTASPAFRQIVNLTFIRSGQFERVGRGEYRVK